MNDDTVHFIFGVNRYESPVFLDYYHGKSGPEVIARYMADHPEMMNNNYEQIFAVVPSCAIFGSK